MIFAREGTETLAQALQRLCPGLFPHAAHSIVTYASSFTDGQCASGRWAPPIRIRLDGPDDGFGLEQIDLVAWRDDLVLRTGVDLAQSLAQFPGAGCQPASPFPNALIEGSMRWRIPTT